MSAEWQSRRRLAKLMSRFFTREEFAGTCNGRRRDCYCEHLTYVKQYWGRHADTYPTLEDIRNPAASPHLPSVGVSLGMEGGFHCQQNDRLADGFSAAISCLVTQPRGTTEMMQPCLVYLHALSLVGLRAVGISCLTFN